MPDLPLFLLVQVTLTTTMIGVERGCTRRESLTTTPAFYADSARSTLNCLPAAVGLTKSEGKCHMQSTEISF